ncbi:MAG: TIGR02757 family protein [Saprospiraceae bacterium]|nr:TIGR02757 family protein [Saprospiraceae bacterium]
MDTRLKDYLDLLVQKYNQKEFIPLDPISIPHRYRARQDIEIAGLMAALFSWGNRTAIIKKAKEAVLLMDDAPYDFVMNAEMSDLKPLRDFQYRTFNGIDFHSLIGFFKATYSQFESMEDYFLLEEQPVFNGLERMHQAFIQNPNFTPRSKKHFSSPKNKSACKRLNMFLRWMVRSDAAGVDFGIWKKLSPSQLLMPLDTHVYHVAKGLGILTTQKPNWDGVLYLTDQLRAFDPTDPVKYDFALFGLGIESKKVQ